MALFKNNLLGSRSQGFLNTGSTLGQMPMMSPKPSFPGVMNPTSPEVPQVDPNAQQIQQDQKMASVGGIFNRGDYNQHMIPGMNYGQYLQSMRSQYKR